MQDLNSVCLKSRAASHQDCQVGLWRAADHVRDEALVSGRIQDGEMFFLGLKVGPPDLHCLALVPLLLVGVQSPRQVPAPSESARSFHKMINAYN